MNEEYEKNRLDRILKEAMKGTKPLLNEQAKETFVEYIKQRMENPNIDKEKVQSLGELLAERNNQGRINCVGGFATLKNKQDYLKGLASEFFLEKENDLLFLLDQVWNEAYRRGVNSIKNLEAFDNGEVFICEGDDE